MDMHIHTCLSPCASAEMVPGAIAARAKEAGLDGIAICDHNSAENAVAVHKAGQTYGIEVLTGMEICSSEEAHVLAYFDNEDALMAMQDKVYDHLFGENDTAYFGEQTIVDEHDELLGSSNRLLIGATRLSAGEIVDAVHELGGAVIASHVDREVFSLIGQLGFIPDGLKLDAIELSWRCDRSDIEGYRNMGFPLVRSSDAHYLSDIGKAWATFRMESCDLSEILKALAGRGSRSVGI